MITAIVLGEGRGETRGPGTVWTEAALVPEGYSAGRCILPILVPGRSWFRRGVGLVQVSQLLHWGVTSASHVREEVHIILQRHTPRLMRTPCKALRVRRSLSLEDFFDVNLLLSHVRGRCYSPV